VPTYFVSAASGRLSGLEKQSIAKAITRIHNEVTGAQTFFAQVIFNEISNGNHFMGGVPLSSATIFVYGHIRAGRSSERKRDLLVRIVDAISDGTGFAKRFIWAYLAELPPSQMIEYGHLLPEPGTESEWLANMPTSDREYMERIGK
jgi:phenylpyruvate tautomerase PptA (4-oxalocrotonate tautomerase family)